MTTTMLCVNNIHCTNLSPSNVWLSMLSSYMVTPSEYTSLSGTSTPLFNSGGRNAAVPRNTLYIAPSCITTFVPALYVCFVWASPNRVNFAEPKSHIFATASLHGQSFTFWISILLGLTSRWMQWIE